MLARNGGDPLRNTPFPAWPVYGPGEEEALLAVLHSGRWFLDAHIQLFEREFAAFQQAEFGIATSNGTTALQVALDAIGIRRVGAIGHLGTFSFQASKNLCAGEGGFITTDDGALADRAWSVHNCGQSRTGAWYEHPLVGSNYRISEFHAALLLSQLKRLAAQTARQSHRRCPGPGLNQHILDFALDLFQPHLVDRLFEIAGRAADDQAFDGADLLV